MMIHKKGNIFTTQAQTIVNTVNTVGVMGAGIAYEFRLRYPDMYQKYIALCDDGMIGIGKLWIYNAPDRKILNFPTKKHWKYPSKEDYLHAGLQKFVDTYGQRGIESIAFPLLGADRGGMDADRSVEIMESYLSRCEIDVEIWHFDPTARDDLLERFVELMQTLDISEIQKATSIRADILSKIAEAAWRDDINSISGMLRIKGVGDKTLEKLFDYVMHHEREMTLLDYMEEGI